MQQIHKKWCTRISKSDWDKAFLLTFKSSIAFHTQESNNQLLTRWYRSPAFLHKFTPSIHDRCWWCDAPGGTLLHIWLTCLQPFWCFMFQLCHPIMGRTWPETPEVTLLSIIPESDLKDQKGLLHFLVSKARALIPRHWKLSTPPTIGECVAELNSVMRLEESTAGLH